MDVQGLRQFGPTLIHHTQLKVREGVRTEGFMMVDSPGMIDSPVSSGGMSHASADGSAIMDRGYDFQGVVRWFAERADVVLLMFDPDKPGEWRRRTVWENAALETLLSMRRDRRPILLQRT